LATQSAFPRVKSAFVASGKYFRDYRQDDFSFSSEEDLVAALNMGKEEAVAAVPGRTKVKGKILRYVHPGALFSLV
jgi:hypothetical protein